jgi:hypothetical protein
LTAPVAAGITRTRRSRSTRQRRSTSCSTSSLQDDPGIELGSDQCVIRGEEFYIRGLIQVPIRDDARVFEWGVCVSLSRDEEAAAAGPARRGRRCAAQRSAAPEPNQASCSVTGEE